MYISITIIAIFLNIYGFSSISLSSGSSLTTTVNGTVERVTTVSSSDSISRGDNPSTTFTSNSTLEQSPLTIVASDVSPRLPTADTTFSPEHPTSATAANGADSGDQVTSQPAAAVDDAFSSSSSTHITREAHSSPTTTSTSAAPSPSITTNTPTSTISTTTTTPTTTTTMPTTTTPSTITSNTPSTTSDVTTTPATAHRSSATSTPPDMFSPSNNGTYTTQNLENTSTHAPNWHKWTTTKIIICVICIGVIILALALVTSSMIWIVHLRRKKLIKEAHDRSEGINASYSKNVGDNFAYMHETDEVTLNGVEFNNPMYTSDKKLDEIAL